MELSSDFVPLPSCHEVVRKRKSVASLLLILSEQSEDSLDQLLIKAITNLCKVSQVCRVIYSVVVYGSVFVCTV